MIWFYLWYRFFFSLEKLASYSPEQKYENMGGSAYPLRVKYTPAKCNRVLPVQGSPWEIIFGKDNECRGWKQNQEGEFQGNFLAELIFSSPSSMWREDSGEVLLQSFIRNSFRPTKRSGEMWHFKLSVTKVSVFDKNFLLDLKFLAAFLCCSSCLRPFYFHLFTLCLYVSPGPCSLIWSVWEPRVINYQRCPPLWTVTANTDIPKMLHVDH